MAVLFGVVPADVFSLPKFFKKKKKLLDFLREQGMVLLRRAES